MKKFYSLITTVLLSTAAFAQNQFVDRVINGDCEGDDVSCFFVHEYRDGDYVETNARLVVDPTDPNNHVAISSSRDQEEGEALDDWHTQFFVYVAEKINVGDEYRLTMRIRADKAANSQTQAHNTPGDYNYWSMCGDIPFTEDWQTIVKEGVIGTNQVYGEEDPETSTKEMHTIAFNLYVLKEANNYYFDDIKLEIKKTEGPHELTGWFDLVKNGNLETDDVSSFTGRDGIDGVDRPARIVEIDGMRALNVTSEDLAINPETGETISVDDWRTQFFVTIPHKFHINDKFHFEMMYKADKPATVQTQIHREPGDYLYYEMLGDINFTNEWQKLEIEGEINSNQSGGYTVAFNCNVLKEYNNYYFKDIVFQCNEADILEEERTAGTEDISLPVPAPGAMATATIDMTAAVEALNTDFKELISESSLKVQTANGLTQDKVSPVFDGVSFDANGYEDDEGFISVEIDEDSSNNNAIFIINNFGDAPLAEGQEINTRFCFVGKTGWYYIYNVKFLSADGIDEFTSASSTDGQIYDLTGRMISKPAKGIYILNGKKYIQN